MLFCDLALAKRLERAEGHACTSFADARRRMNPESAAEWIECAGTYAVFDGPDSPITQTFGLGIFEPLTASCLDTIEKFFRDRGAPVMHEVSPFAGIATLDMLCRKNYRPTEISNVLFRPVERPQAGPKDHILVRIVAPEESELWAGVSARGWAHEHPELEDFLLELGRISPARQDSVCFLAEINGTPGAAGVLCIHQRVALFGGAATVPEMRRQGLQGALLHTRMTYALDHDCDIAMMVAEPGSESQRNAERRGFKIAYTRTKWKLCE